MPYCRLDHTFAGDPKIADFAQLYGVSLNEARGMCAFLWSWCLTHAKDGNFANRDALAAALVPDGDCITALVGSGLVIDKGDGSFAVYGWMQRADSYRTKLRLAKYHGPGVRRKRPETAPSVVIEETREPLVLTAQPMLPAVKSPDPVELVVEHYLTRYPKRIAQTSNRAVRDKIKKRLDDGYTVEQLCQAIDGNAASEFHTNGGFTDLALIVRDATQVDRFLAVKAKPSATESIRRRYPLLAPDVE